MQALKQQIFKNLVDAGLVHSVKAVAHHRGWELIIHFGNAEAALTTGRGEARAFRKFETLVLYLKDLGINKFDVDAEAFDPVAFKLSRSNKAAHERMKAVHSQKTSNN